MNLPGDKAVSAADFSHPQKAFMAGGACGKIYGKENGQMARLKYSRALAGRLYRFFAQYDGEGAPSVVKFAASVGATTEQIEAFRSHKEFDRAYRECCEIRRDYLEDRALSKRFDPTFVKFLLSDGKDTTDDTLNVHITVTE